MYYSSMVRRQNCPRDGSGPRWMPIGRRMKGKKHHPGYGSGRTDGNRARGVAGESSQREKKKKQKNIIIIL